MKGEPSRDEIKTAKRNGTYNSFGTYRGGLDA